MTTSENVIQTANTLRAKGLLQSADETLAAALVEFPDNASILAEYCWAAHRREMWTEATLRWSQYQSRFPDHLLGYSGRSSALLQSGRIDDAEHAVIEGMRRFCNDFVLMANFAWVAHRRSNWSDALARWTAFTEAYPNYPLGYLKAGIALRELRRFDEADAVLRAGIETNSSDPELRADYARVASHREEWAEAHRRCSDYCERYPDQALGHQQVAVVMGWLGNFAEADNQSIIVAKSSSSLTAKLMLQFEGLGDNCEFGLVQRHFGAEPLGLLRWAGISADHLVRALETQFEGVGSSAQTELGIQGGEYYVQDSRFGMSMHTFIPEGSADRDRVSVQQCRRVKFLRDKMLGDLASGEKIFLHKPRNGRLTDKEMWSIFHALRLHGPNRLFCIILSDERHPAGTIECISDGLIVGFIDRVSKEANQSEIAYASWLSLLEQASSAFDHLGQRVGIPDDVG